MTVEVEKTHAPREILIRMPPQLFHVMAQIKTRPIARKARGAAKAIALSSNRIDAPPSATAASACLENPYAGRLAATGDG